MSEPGSGNEGLEGKMYLYEQPEPLSVEEHGELGMSGVRNYRFAAGCQTIPLAMTEFRSAQRHFPIVFSGADTPMPLAVVSAITFFLLEAVTEAWKIPLLALERAVSGHAPWQAKPWTVPVSGSNRFLVRLSSTTWCFGPSPK